MANKDFIEFLERYRALIKTDQGYFVHLPRLAKYLYQDTECGVGITVQQKHQKDHITNFDFEDDYEPMRIEEFEAFWLHCIVENSEAEVTDGNTFKPEFSWDNFYAAIAYIEEETDRLWLEE
jgi:hypothetical protein